ncbi:MAG: NAD+ synthase [Chitinophagaceae bacterium]
MKIFLAQQNYHIGNFDYNLGKILQAVERAKQSGADLVVFSELSVCGYPPRDFLEFDDFIRQCYHSIDQIREAADTLGIIVGSPSLNRSGEGKPLYNSAWFLSEKKIQQVVHKTLLPTYDVFDEYRYFEPASDWAIIPFRGYQIALTICEDIWNLGDNPLYRICPMDQLMPFDPDVMINISASPFDYDQEEKRPDIIRRNVQKYQLPMFYCNAVGSQTEIVFDGGSMIFDDRGKQIMVLPYFEEGELCADLEEMLKGSPKKSISLADPIPDHPLQFSFDPKRHMDRIRQALILGIRDYFQKMGFKKALLGSSGGIDSAVTAALACEALGSENVHTVLLPSPFSSEHSLQDGLALSANLGCQVDQIPIHEIYSAFVKTLAPNFQGLPFGLAEENIQARIRGNLLMALANKFGWILLNTSNKSELSTGYGTLYGDMAGGLSVLGDLYKTQVYALANLINQEQVIIPENVLLKAPSAELRPNQKDLDSLPPYELLDPILFQYIDRRQGPREIMANSDSPEWVDRILKMVNSSEYKRNQFCPIIRISSKAFGVGRRVPIVGKYLS